jgi:bile acid:Na+ symporter, BASS family
MLRGGRGVGRLIATYPELTAVLAAAVIGLTVRSPLAWLAGHQAIDILLAILVLATAVTIEPAALRGLARTWPLLVVVLAVGITVLPALSWAVSRIVEAGPLRDGVMTVGLAPCEIASVATTAMAAGDAALSAGVLIGSTVASVALAGPVLALETSPASSAAAAGTPHPLHIVASLGLVVILPLAAGLALRARLPVIARADRAASVTATAAVAALVAVIASQVPLSASYLPVALALIAFLASSAIIGWLPGARSSRPAAAAVLLTTSMRDFAIAAGLAAAAFGPAAAAPLGLYGILVIAWGTAVAGLLRQRR